MLMTFNRLKKLATDAAVVADIAKTSDLLEVSADNTQVTRLFAFLKRRKSSA